MSRVKAPNINYLWAEMIIEELYRNGVRHICIAPGSRSTPLTLAAADHGGMKQIVHFDERGLAFFALGISSVYGDPVALISTSGTAVANFFPALIEASKKKLPLIFLTADRPPELRNSGALQTIDQQGIFGGYVRWSVDLPVPDKNIRNEFVLTTIDQALFMSKSPLPGPVHINCMFREPLAPEESGEITGKDSVVDKEWRNNNSPYTTYFKNRNTTDQEAEKAIADIINGAEYGIIVAGKLKNRQESESVVRLSEHLNWPLFGDVVSGIKNIPGKNSVNNWDLLLLKDRLFGNQVDTVIHFGGRMTSKRWYRFVDRERPVHYVTVLNHPLKNDPLHVVSHRIYSEPGLFAGKLVEMTERKGVTEKLKNLLYLSQQTGKLVDDFINDTSRIDEIFIARKISELTEPGDAIFLGNSMPVRDMDMFFHGGDKDILWGGNRGSSGIDGNIAAASGLATASGRNTTLIIGDVAALHDLNSLQLASKVNPGVTICIVNNNGGGIFSFLPVSELWGDNKNYFLTPHNLDFEKVAEMFDMGYFRVRERDELQKYFKIARERPGSNIVEIIVDMEFNVKSHKQIMKKLTDFYKISDGGGINE